MDMDTRKCAHCGNDFPIDEGKICEKNEHFIYEPHATHKGGVLSAYEVLCPLDKSKLR